MKFSTLNRTATWADIDVALNEFRDMLEILRHRPRVVVLENIASMVLPHRRQIFEAYCTILLAWRDFKWTCDILCPSWFGGPIARPRLFFVGFLDRSLWPPEGGYQVCLLIHSTSLNTYSFS